MVTHDVGLRLCFPQVACSLHAMDTSFHVFTDSLVLASVLQGRACARQPSLAALVSSANSFIAALPLRHGHCPDYWWISHTRRSGNSAADEVARQAREHLASLTIIIHDVSLWSSWCAHGPQTGANYFCTCDGSTVPERPSARGSSGAACILWAAGCEPRPVATTLLSHFWATAISAEIAAVQLALAWLSATPLSERADFHHSWSPVLEHPLEEGWFHASAFLEALHTVVEAPLFDCEGNIKDLVPLKENSKSGPTAGNPSQVGCVQRSRSHVATGHFPSSADQGAA